MSDAPDPLGKRALFWAPAERHEEGPRRPDGDEVAGKYALFSETRSVTTSDGRAGARPSPTDRELGGSDGHPPVAHQRVERRATTAGGQARDRRGAVSPDDLERPVGSGMFGILTLQCSSCRVRSQVDLVEYVVLHLPLWFWRPGRGYTRFMTCPACRRRTWVSASWRSWTR